MMGDRVSLLAGARQLMWWMVESFSMYDSSAPLTGYDRPLAAAGAL